MHVLLAAVLALTGTLISKTSDLAGTWEGLSVCSDKTQFPTVHDEHWICHVTARDAKSVMVQINKIEDGKEVAMAPEPVPMAFDQKAQTLTARLGGRKPSLWVFKLTYSTWVGSAKNEGGQVFRQILVKRN